MRLNAIKPAAGAKHAAKRVGRGIGSGLGKTAGRGHKGQKSRTGGFHKVGFEGGQMPMQRRLPKRGFKNINREAYAPLNLNHLEALSQKLGASSFDVESLVAAGVSKASEKIKLLGKGKLTAKINIKVHAASAAAKAAVEAAGGSVEIV